MLYLMKGAEVVNLTLLTDFYEFTMANGFYKEGMGEKTAYFDMFFRRVPDNGGFAILAGIEQVIEYIKEIKFTSDDIEYLRSKGVFCEELRVMYGQSPRVRQFFRTSQF